MKHELVPNLASKCCRAFSSKCTWAVLALVLFSLVGTACSARMLSIEGLSTIFFEEDWLHPAEGGGGTQPENPAESAADLASSPAAAGNDGSHLSASPAETFTATPEPSSVELQATQTPEQGSPTPTATFTPIPTWTPLPPASSATPQPTPTATRRPPTATPSVPSPTATPSVPSPTATPTVLSPTATNTTPPTATATSAPPTATPETCTFSSSASYETALIALINQERANQGIAALTVSSQLTAAARQHSRDMACNDFFSHTGSDGSSPFDRMASSGFSFSAAAENLFAGSSSAQQAFNAWMNSSGHRTNMLNPTYTHVGVGYIYSASSTYGSYYTANFARP